ncbi:MAG TPA: hypothetical protein VFC78_04405 [Tepidisphaeraceae bacterium]|nr:hypothetical protein [Tepidisphaeraceae bacterium]
MPEPRNPVQAIEQLQKRYETLKEKKITAEANYKNATNQLDDLKANAQRSYGTDDLAALREKLKQMEADNERKRGEYQAHLDKIESDLKEVDQKFNQAPAGK